MRGHVIFLLMEYLFLNNSKQHSLSLDVNDFQNNGKLLEWSQTRIFSACINTLHTSGAQNISWL